MESSGTPGQDREEDPGRDAKLACGEARDKVAVKIFLQDWHTFSLRVRNSFERDITTLKGHSSEYEKNRDVVDLYRHML